MNTWGSIHYEMCIDARSYVSDCFSNIASTREFKNDACAQVIKDRVCNTDDDIRYCRNMLALRRVVIFNKFITNFLLSRPQALYTAMKTTYQNDWKNGLSTFSTLLYSYRSIFSWRQEKDVLHILSQVKLGYKWGTFSALVISMYTNL